MVSYQRCGSGVNGGKKWQDRRHCARIWGWDFLARSSDLGEEEAWHEDSGSSSSPLGMPCPFSRKYVGIRAGKIPSRTPGTVLSPRPGTGPAHSNPLLHPQASVCHGWMVAHGALQAEPRCTETRCGKLEKRGEKNHSFSWGKGDLRGKMRLSRPVGGS